MATITLEEAQSRLPELIEKLIPGEDLVIMRDEEPVARIVAVPTVPREPRKFGTLKGTVLYMAPDFNAPMEFKE